MTIVSFSPPEDLCFPLVSVCRGAQVLQGDLSPKVVGAQPPEWPWVKFWFHHFAALKSTLQGSVY